MTCCSYFIVVCSAVLMSLSGVAMYWLMKDCIFDRAARIAAVSMPNCPCARVGPTAKTASETAAALSSVGRYHGRSSGWTDSMLHRGLPASDVGRCFRAQKKGLRNLVGFFLGSVITDSP